MKKFFCITAVVVSIAACSVSEIDKQPQGIDVTSFVKGQKVTLTVGTGTDTKAVGTHNTISQCVDFKWEEGDKIKVIVGGASSEFTLKSGAGEATATFEGMMPEGGSSFDVQYPYAGLEESALANQTYSSTTAIPHDMMLATATECTGTSFSLKPQYAALRLNLYCDTPIGSVVVTNLSTSASYTLECNGVEAPESNDTKPFYVVMPAGKYLFRVEIYDNAETPALINSKELTALKAENELVAGKVLNMPTLDYPGTDLPPVKIGDIVWAPVNCGYNSTHRYGLLYQFGRKDGTGYDSAEGMQEYDSSTTDIALMTDQTKFYKHWGALEWVSSNNPCPDGWRVPAMSELYKLIGGSEDPPTEYVEDGGWDESKKGYWFNGTSDPKVSEGLIFLAAGIRDSESGVSVYRDDNFGNAAYYWSSTSINNESAFIYFLQILPQASYVTLLRTSAPGCSVRCIKE